MKIGAKGTQKKMTTIMQNVQKSKKTKPYFFLLLATVLMLISTTGCHHSDNTEPSDSVSSDALESDTALKQEEAALKTDTVNALMALDIRIDKTFAEWLYDNHKDAAVLISNLSTEEKDEYDGRIWHRLTHKSFFVLRDEALAATGENTDAKQPVLMETKDSEKAVLRFAGDVSFAPDYLPAQRYAAGGIDAAFSKTLQQTMRDADFFMVNNETSISDRGQPLVGKKYTFRAPSERTKWLTEIGADAVSLANNHTFDYGEEALVDTLSHLQSEGISYVGAGMNIDEASAPIYFILNGQKIGIVASTDIERSYEVTRGATDTLPGVLRCNDPTRTCASIQYAKENCDFVIAFIHWGNELELQYDWRQEELAHLFVDAGADAVIGSHPHVLEGVEYYRNTPIFYSLSNFSFGSKQRDSCVLELVLTSDGITETRFIPCMENYGQTIQCEVGDNHYNRILDTLNTYSADGIQIDTDGNVMQILR